MSAYSPPGTVLDFSHELCTLIHSSLTRVLLGFSILDMEKLGSENLSRFAEVTQLGQSRGEANVVIYIKGVLCCLFRIVEVRLPVVKLTLPVIRNVNFIFQEVLF